MPATPETAFGEVSEASGDWWFPEPKSDGTFSELHVYPSLNALLAAWDITIVGHYVSAKGTLRLLWERRRHPNSRAHIKVALLARAAELVLQQPESAGHAEHLAQCIQGAEVYVRAMEALEKRGTQ